MSAVAVLVPENPDDLAAQAASVDMPATGVTPEPADQLHCTIAYADTEDPAMLQLLADTVSDLAAAGVPMEAEIVSVEPLGDDGAIVAMLDSAPIVEAHDALQAKLEAAPGGDVFAWQFPSFIAHMTLAYGPPPAPDGDDSDQALLDAAAEALQPMVGTTVMFTQVGIMDGDTIIATPLGSDETRVPLEDGMASTTGGTEQLATNPDLEALVGTAVSYLDPETGQDETGVVQAVDDEGICEVIRDSDGQVVIVPVIDLVPADEPDPEAAPVPTPAMLSTEERLETQRAAARERMKAAAGGVGNGAAEFNGTGTVNAPAPTEVADDGTWEGVLVIEGVPSGDGRLIAAGALTHRELPLPLMVMFRNPDSGAPGHAGAELAGRIDWIERREDGAVWGGGKLDMESTAGKETHRLMREGFMRGVSVDLDDVTVEFENEMPDDMDLEGLMGFDPGNMIVTAARVMGATMTVFPAFQEAQLVLLSAAPGVGFSDEPCGCGMAHDGAVDDEALVASAGSGLDGTEVRVWTPWQEGALVASAGAHSETAPVPNEPPLEWFEMAVLDGPTKLRVSKDGRLIGHVSEWGSCHLAYSNRCVPVPRATDDYSMFRGGSVLTAEGRLVATGPILVDTVHPNLKMRASDAMAFYAHTGCAVADVAVYEDEWGIQVAGALRPGVTWAQVRALRGSDISPDWRRAGPGRGRQMVAMLAVNNSAFKVRENVDPLDLPALVASAGVDVQELVASGLEGAVRPGGVAVEVQLSSGDVGSMVGARRPNAGRGNRPYAVLMAAMTQLRAELAAVKATADASAAQLLPARREQARAKLHAIAGGDRTG